MCVGGERVSAECRKSYMTGMVRRRNTGSCVVGFSAGRLEGRTDQVMRAVGSDANMHIAELTAKVRETETSEKAKLSAGDRMSLVPPSPPGLAAAIVAPAGRRAGELLALRCCSGVAGVACCESCCICVAGPSLNCMLAPW